MSTIVMRFSPRLLRQDRRHKKLRGANFANGPDELILRDCVETVCAGHHQNHIRRVLLEHVNKPRHSAVGDARRCEHIGRRKHFPCLKIPALPNPARPLKLRSEV